MNIALIGTGRLGASLARALPPGMFSLKALHDRDGAAARRCRRRIGRGRVVRTAAEAAAAGDVILLCVPDRAVAEVAEVLARAPLRWNGKIVLHTSGALSSQTLGPLKRAGAAVGSMHPAQSFAGPETPPSRFRGVFFAVEGDPKAAAAARRLARSVGGRPYPIGAGDKALYHAACSLASNMLVPLFDRACALLEETGIRPRHAARILLPLVEGTVENLKGLDRARALTGPIARGDKETVRLHLESLRGRKRDDRIYRLLGAQALVLAERRGVDQKTVKALARRLAGT
jgi:predicted short-subunit dehydrogenase-like oxidoreductase (DUF2520 family)